MEILFVCYADSPTQDVHVTFLMQAVPRVGDEVALPNGVYTVTNVLWTPEDAPRVATVFLTV